MLAILLEFGQSASLFAAFRAPLNRSSVLQEHPQQLKDLNVDEVTKLSDADADRYKSEVFSCVGSGLTEIEKRGRSDCC